MLEPAQIETLKTDGFLVLPGLAGAGRAATARRRVHATLGAEGADPARLAEFSSSSWTPSVLTHPDLLNLVDNDDVRPVLDRLFGPGRLKPAAKAQVALRFPQAPEEGDETTKQRFENGGALQSAHIDGLPHPGNGVPPGKVHNFAVLVGVLLNDQPTAYRGNFRAHPGSHEEMAAYFRSHGTDDLARTATPPVATAPPTQVTGQAGDVVLAHHLTVHGNAPNLCPEVRMNAFFRFWPRGRGKFSREALLDPWAEWRV